MWRQYYTPKPDVSKARIAHISRSLGRECEGNTIPRNVGNYTSKDTQSHRTRPGFSIVPLWKPHNSHSFVIYAILRRRGAKPLQCAAFNHGGLKHVGRHITLHAPPTALIPTVERGPDRHRRISFVQNVVTHWPEGSKRSDVHGRWRTTCVSRDR